VDELKKKSVMLSQGEINALKKAILYLKFECEDVSSMIFSGSTLINSAFDELLVNSDTYEREAEFYHRENPDAQELIVQKIKQQQYSDSESHEEETIDDEYLRCCLHPFKKTGN